MQNFVIADGIDVVLPGANGNFFRKKHKVVDGEKLCYGPLVRKVGDINGNGNVTYKFSDNPNW